MLLVNGMTLILRGRERSVICHPLRLVGGVIMKIGSQISRRVLATPLSGSTWLFSKFTDEIENGRVYLPFSV